MSSPPLRPQIGSSQAATLTHSQSAYLERLRGRDADAPDADPCASLWAYSSLRSRYTGQPAPWRWCCQSYCRSDSMKAEWSCRCPAVIICVYESVISNTPRELGSNQTVRFLPRPSLLPLPSSAVCGPSVQVTTLCWEWFIWAWLTFRRRREVQQWEGLPTQTWGRQAFAKQRSFICNVALSCFCFVYLFVCLFVFMFEEELL